jgi:hypothetical protein
MLYLIYSACSVASKFMLIRVTLKNAKINIFYGIIRSKYFTSVGVEHPFFT